jgi:hypothetical protein
VPNPDEPYIREELERKGVRVEPLRAPTSPSGFLWTTLVYLRQNTLGRGATARTLQSRYANARAELARTKPLVAFALDLPLRLLWRSRRLRRAALRAEERLFSPRRHRDLFARYRPALVVTTSVGWFLPDAVVLREAKREGVPTAATVVAWDNPTSKGYRGAEPDLTVAWSDAMSRQLIDHHDLDPRRIAVGGVPQFDPYVRPGELPSREALFRELDLDPERRLILFACRSPSSYSRNLTVAAVLSDAIERDALEAPAQAVVRPHPINFRSDHRAPMTAYRELAERHEHLVIDVPIVSSELMACDVPEDNYRRLGALMAHCDVLVNAFSTTTLEGFLLGRPVVLVSDEAHRSEDSADEAREDRPFHLDTHMEAVVERDAARVARSFREIPECVNAYLRNPELDAEARHAVAAHECGPADGLAGRRVGSLLLQSIGWEAWPAARSGVQPSREQAANSRLSDPGREGTERTLAADS